MKNSKFIIGISVISLAILYLAITGFQQDYAYYLTADEFVAKIDEMGDSGYQDNYRVAGQVVMGSIDRSESPMTFEIDYNDVVLPVAYVGNGPIPDTFKDHAQAVVSGKMTADGMFHADHIQAKCASKYEAMLDEGQSGYGYEQ
jgi:cytochrome c-type biogenesis protein CcmE